MRPITEFKALTFDCYGTLIDWESGIWDALQPMIAGSGSDLDRGTALLAFADAESAQQASTPGMLYPEILAHVHRALAKRFGLTRTIEMDRVFGNSVAHWPAFPDTADALRRLKRHYRLAILSNVHRDGFAASNRKLGVTFDAIYTAQDIGPISTTSGSICSRVSASRRGRSCTPLRAFSTTMSLARRRDSPAPGSTGRALPRAGRAARPPRSPRGRRSSSVSRR